MEDAADNDRQRKIQQRLASYNKEALIVAQNSQSENTKKAYRLKQRK